MHILDTLKERGFIAQTTFEPELYKQLEKPTSFYVGFDPTAASLHFGHFIPIIAMAHMQRAGHRPIALVGGGTAIIGDPSGKTEMRKMLTKEQIKNNIAGIKSQLSRFIDFSDGKALLVDNADWLLNLNYVEFIREIGVHFSVNRMLAAECYKQRYERGLTFLEFNYMLMQAYDFLTLYRKYDCLLEMGGDDQWSNMLAGADLVRRVEKAGAFACTFKLLLNSEGVKMGKTVNGALWLDENLCSPYEFYQYWRNIADADVPKCLSLLTFLPMDEVRRLSALKDSEINEAKKILAFECTKLVHGEEKALNAQKASSSLFESSDDMSNVPSFNLSHAMLDEDSRLSTIMKLCGLVKSNSEARKMLEQGAVSVNGEKINDVDYRISHEALDNSDGLLIRKGKKSYCRIIKQ